MKVLFLDIDGVLNCHDFDPLALCGPIHRDKVRLLNGILIATGAKIVLSSAWRYIVHRGETTLEGMDWLLRSHGVQSGRLIGITRTDTMIERCPAWNGKAEWPQVNERGQQIRDWLNEHPEVTRSVALDDMDLGITNEGIWLVQTDGEVGLTTKEVAGVMEVLR